MTTINRPLTDEERSLVNMLAIASISQQTRCNQRTAAEVLDMFAETGDVILRGDTEDIYLEVSGKVLVHCKRDWLAFHAEHPEAIDLQRHGRVIPDGQDS